MGGGSGGGKQFHASAPVVSSCLVDQVGEYLVTAHCAS